ncbi:MAG TPA: CARDB domain-containing protein [Candidatus Saccharimonadales bacterium]|nr:CARDB domain-containing protein [Candidatus Saccharimonadales bacterium]
MTFSNINNLPFRAKFTLVAGIFLLFGVFGAVLIAQKQQQIRSHASGDIAGDFPGDLVGDDFRVNGKVLGNIIGNRNQVSNGVTGGIYGGTNSIIGNVGGCINGDNNRISGSVAGGVVGTNNIVTGTKGTGDCPLPGSTTAAPTVIPPTDTPVPTLTDIPPTATIAPTISPTVTPTVIIKPDLIITGMQITLDDSNGSYVCSTGLGLKVTVKNQGVAPLPVSFTVKANNTQKIVDGGLNAGASVSVWIPDYVYSGSNTATVDPGNQIDESDETNNQLTQNVPVPTQPVSCLNPSPTSIPSPTSTPVPGSTILSLNLFLHGIGKAGDSANPGSGGNMNPVHPYRIVKVQVYDNNNQLVVEKDGTVYFANILNSTSGNFVGNVDLGSGIADGQYLIKVKSPQFLRTIVPGIQNITIGTINQMPQVALVNGDVNGDNAANILDYNLIIGCYSDLVPAISCTPENKLLTDLDDDGAVNQFDYNLFLRELTNRLGQ